MYLELSHAMSIKAETDENTMEDFSKINHFSQKFCNFRLRHNIKNMKE